MADARSDEFRDRDDSDDGSTPRRSAPDGANGDSDSDNRGSAPGPDRVFVGGVRSLTETARFMEAAQNMLSRYDAVRVLTAAQEAFAARPFTSERLSKVAREALAAQSFTPERLSMVTQEAVASRRWVSHEHVLKAAHAVLASYDPARVLEQAVAQLSTVDFDYVLNDLRRALNSHMWFSDLDGATLSSWAIFGLAATAAVEQPEGGTRNEASSSTSLTDDVLASVIAALAVFGIGCVLVVAVMEPDLAMIIATWLTIIPSVAWAARRGIALLPGAGASPDASPAPRT